MSIPFPLSAAARAWALPVLAAACLMAAPLAAPAQQPVELQFGQRPDDPTPGRLALRPNVAQEVFVFVKNPSDAADQTVTVQLLVGAGEAAQPVAEKEVTTPKGGKPLLVSLGKAPPPDAPPVKAAPLAGPAWFRLLDKDKKPIAKSERAVGYQLPSEYMTAKQIAFFPKDADRPNKLVVTVQTKDTFAGPLCRVDLDLKPERIVIRGAERNEPGFSGTLEKLGNWGGDLRKANETASLKAENLPVREGGPEGPVYLTVDAYERAFRFNVTFAGKETPSVPEALIAPQAYFNPPSFASPEMPLKLHIELDGLPPNGLARLSLRSEEFVDEGGKLVTKERYNTIAEFKSNRSESLLFAKDGPRGGLVFQPVAQDWLTELNLKAVQGVARLRLQMVEVKDDKEEVIKLRDNVTGKVNQSAVDREIVLDGTPPKGVEFNKPATAQLGESVILSASSKEPAGTIAEVVFYLGKPLPDGKMPPTAEPIKAAPDPKLANVWVAAEPVRVPRAGVETLDVSVRFTKKAGGSAIVTHKILVEDPNFKPAGAAQAKASITGFVVEGERPQVGITVELRDTKDTTKPEPKAAIPTDKEGKFEFKGLDPGRYRLSAFKSASNTRANVIVDLRPGQNLLLDGMKDKDGKANPPPLKLFR